MKILFFLTTLIYSCNGGISSGYGGNSIQEIEIEPQQLHHIHQVELMGQQGYHNAQHGPVEVLQIQNVENDGSYGGGHGGFQSEWQPIAQDVHSHQPQAQIIKIIHEEGPNVHGRHSAGHGLGGQSQPQIIKIIEEPSFGGSHGGSGGPSQSHQIFKIIEEQSHGGHDGGYGGAHGGGHGGGHDGGHGGGHVGGHDEVHGGGQGGGHGGPSSFAPNFGGHGSSSQSQPEIIYTAPPSHGHSSSSGGGGNSGKSSNPLSSLGSIIPQFLRLLFGGGGGNSAPSKPFLGGGGPRPVNTPNAGKLISAYGNGGTTKITRQGKHPNSFYSSGRVIESGTLKISSAKKGGRW